MTVTLVLSARDLLESRVVRQLDRLGDQLDADSCVCVGCLDYQDRGNARQLGQTVVVTVAVERGQRVLQQRRKRLQISVQL